MKNLTPMPVFDALRSPGRRCYWTLNDDDYFFSHQGNFQVFSECTRVWFGQAPSDTDILSKGLTGRNIDTEGLAGSVGPQNLPYDHLWLEGTYAPGAAGIKGAVAQAIYCHSNDARDALTVKPLVGLQSTTYQFFALMDDGSIRRMPMAALTTFTDTGQVQGFTVKALAPEGNFLRDVGELGEGYAEWAASMALPAMWAVGLMNCKNVRLEEVAWEPKKSKKQRRPRPGIRYHTIVLPGSNSHGGAQSAASPTTAPLHQVRGHFKTFTAERPLLGKHTGTYWWGWQMRGKSENGVVVSDYRLEA